MQLLTLGLGTSLIEGFEAFYVKFLFIFNYMNQKKDTDSDF